MCALAATNAFVPSASKKFMVHTTAKSVRKQLRCIGVEVDVVSSDLQIGWIYSKQEATYKLVGQYIDAIWEEWGGGSGGGGGAGGVHHPVAWHYLLFSGIRIEPGRSSTLAELSNKGWLGGRLAHLLNEDMELSRLLLEQRQNWITIRSDPKKQQVDIRGPYKSASLSKNYPSMTRDWFMAYNRIAKHIRNYMASHSTS
jgi:hypothetical protein